ncbi:MAG: 2-hydroxychromene-2-carboxylate isomerase [Betaproteobacteria bacterium]|jgi:2-hydroxychromene-2-carboxylate isomerase
MERTLSYFMATTSPWTYLGHARIIDICARHGISLNMMPMDLGQVFPISGGLPLGKRAPQRQAYRLFELARWREVAGLPLIAQPKFFPVDGNPAAIAIVAAQLHHGAQAGLRLAAAVLKAVWAEERNIADPQTVEALIAGCGLDTAAVLGKTAEATDTYAANTAQAIEAKVFGAPWYIWKGEPFWGQDRLDLLERAIGRG